MSSQVILCRFFMEGGGTYFEICRFFVTIKFVFFALYSNLNFVRDKMILTVFLTANADRRP